MLRVALCSLVLNEEEFLGWNYMQHRNWPGLVGWVFVEGADKKYAEASPKKVTKDGLSTDGTSKTLDYLKQSYDAETNLLHIKHYGWMQDKKPALAKTVGRDRYLDILEDIKPDIFVVIDADEFYTRKDQNDINTFVEANYDYHCWRFTQRHIWAPPSVYKEPTAYNFRYEVTGGYWDVRHVRVFKWRTGLRYSHDHNYPQCNNHNPLKRMHDCLEGGPQCVHLGFARAAENRKATNSYYVQRGEGRRDGRRHYVSCRSAWEGWQPGVRLPNGAEVKRYDGPIPEIYRQ